VRVLSPNGDEILLANDAVNIRWASGDDIAIAHHRIRLSLDGGRTFPIAVADDLPGTARDVTWLVPDHRSTTAVIRVMAVDAARNVGVDDSDRVFTIQRRPLSAGLIKPNGGEILRPGQTFQIQFVSSEAVTVFLRLSTDGGATFPVPIQTLPPLAESFFWKVPDIPTQHAKVQIEARDGAGRQRFDVSDGVFTILRRLPDPR
jgi:hypothetical protein